MARARGDKPRDLVPILAVATDGLEEALVLLVGPVALAATRPVLDPGPVMLHCEQLLLIPGLNLQISAADEIFSGERL